MKKKLNIALVGLGFGGAFVPIYKAHPDVGTVGIFDSDPSVLKKFSQHYSLDKTYHSYEEILQDPYIDAIHLITPIPLHEEQTVQALRAGKHCACTVPMAISIEGIENIIQAVCDSGKTYMMMETSIYTTHFFHVKEMLKNNEFGKIQFVRGAHYQEMEKWPKYWMGLPPMYYGTHAIAPLVMSVGSHITRVHCFGSGVMDKKLYEQYHNPYPIETAIFDFGNGIKGEATRSLFNTAREYTESFNIYGERATFEWQQLENGGDPIIFRKSSKKSCDTDRNVPIEYERIVPRNREDLLPESIRRFTVKNKYYDETNPQVTFEEGGGHGGSHPHLVNEFIQSILEDRAPWIDLYTAANITAAGICAHKSAMQDGIEIAVPDFQK